MDPCELKVSMLAGVVGSKRSARGIIRKYGEDLTVEELHAKYLSETSQITTSETGNTQRDLAFVLRTMMFSSMAHDPVPLGKKWIRRFQLFKDGKIVEGTITFSSHEDGIGVVYGAMDRKVLTILSSLAVKRRSARHTFASTSDFLGMMNDNERGSAFPEFRASVERWVSCGISLKMDSDEERILSRRGVISDARLPVKNSGMPLVLELDHQFLENLLEEPFPVPWDYLQPFARKPLGWDLAMFLAARVAACRSATRIPLYSKNPEDLTLMKQFSSKDTNPYRWAKNVEEYLVTIQKYWKELRAEVDGRFLTIYPSQYMVPYTGTHRHPTLSLIMDGEHEAPPALFEDGELVSQ